MRYQLTPLLALDLDGGGLARAGGATAAGVLAEVEAGREVTLADAELAAEVLAALGATHWAWEDLGRACAEAGLAPPRR